MSPYLPLPPAALFRRSSFESSSIVDEAEVVDEALEVGEVALAPAAQAFLKIFALSADLAFTASVILGVKAGKEWMERLFWCCGFDIVVLILWWSLLCSVGGVCECACLSVCM